MDNSTGEPYPVPTPHMPPIGGIVSRKSVPDEAIGGRGSTWLLPKQEADFRYPIMIMLEFALRGAASQRPRYGEGLF